MPVADVTKSDGTTMTVNVTNGVYAIQYTDIPEQYRERWTSNSNEITRVVDCAWEDSDQFILECVGWCENNAGSLERHLPEPHPFYPNMWCVAADLVEGMGVPIIDEENGFFDFYDLVRGDIVPATGLIDSGSSPASGRARFVLTYKRLPFGVFADEEVTTEFSRFVQRKYGYAVEHLPIPGTALKFVDTGGAAGLDKVPVRLPTKTLLYVWHDVPAGVNFRLPDTLETSIETCLGQVNDDTFDDRYPAGTLFLDTAETEPIELASGDFGFRITYKMIYRKSGWNTKYRIDDTVHDSGFYAVVDKTGNPVYSLEDFDSLFVLGT